MSPTRRGDKTVSNSPPRGDPFALPETGVAHDTSVTTTDDRLSIPIESVISSSVRLPTRLDSVKASRA